MAMTNERKLLLLGLLRQTEMHGYMLNAHLD
jgi:DNA-binding PadR family transcriptional regulator